jgi:cobyric acid synthase
MWSSLAGTSVDGYEIHAGRSRALEVHQAFLDLEAGPEGSVAADMPVAGTHLHGLLEQPQPRHALIHALAAKRGFTWNPESVATADPFDALADVLETHVRLDGLRLSSLLPLPTR